MSKSEPHCAQNIEAAWRHGRFEFAEKLAVEYESFRGAAEDGPDIRSGGDGRVLWQRCKALTASGRVRRARELLSAPDAQCSDESVNLLLTLERARLDLIDKLVVGTALRLGRIERERPLETDDEAEIEIARCDLLLLAGTVGELTSPEKLALSERIRAIAGSRPARRTRSLALRAEFAALKSAPDTQAVAYGDLADRAVHDGEAALAGLMRLTLAEKLLGAGDAGDVVAAELERASALFIQARHRYGLIDVALVRARNRAAAGAGRAQDFEDCINDYGQAAMPVGQVRALLSLSELARSSGDLALEDACVERIRLLANEFGNRLAHISALVTEVGRLFVDSRWSRIISLCEREIAEGLPSAYEANIQLQVSAAYFASGDPVRAVNASRRALVLTERAGSAVAAQAASRLAADLAASLLPNWSVEAWAILERFVDLSIRSGDDLAAVRLLTQAASLVEVQTRSGQAGTADMDRAIQWVSRAESIARRMISAERAIATLAVMDAYTLLALLDGNDEDWGRRMDEAIALCDEEGLAERGARYRYALGCHHFNRTLTSLERHFGAAEDALIAAAEQLRSLGFIIEAARADERRARLYDRGARLVSLKNRTRMESEALRLLDEGQREIDVRRRDYRAPSALATRAGKRSLTRDATDFRNSALTILLRGNRDPMKALDWVQRSKSRQLNDLMSVTHKLSPEAMGVLDVDGTAKGLLEEEEVLREELELSDPLSRPDVLARIDRLHARLAEQPGMSGYLALRDGSVDTVRARAALAVADTAGAVAFVDYVAVGEVLLVLVARGEADVEAERLTLSLTKVTDFVRQHLGPDRLTQTLAYAP